MRWESRTAAAAAECGLGTRVGYRHDRLSYRLSTIALFANLAGGVLLVAAGVLLHSVVVIGAGVAAVGAAFAAGFLRARDQRLVSRRSVFGSVGSTVVFGTGLAVALLWHRDDIVGVLLAGAATGIGVMSLVLDVVEVFAVAEQVTSIFTGGVVRTDRRGRVTHVFAWSQVEQLRYTGRSAYTAGDSYPQMVANHDEYDLRLRDGGQATVAVAYGFGPAMQPGARMSTALMTGVAFAQWPALRATIESGGTVTFGLVTVDLDGITVKRGPDIVYRRPWGVVDSVTLEVTGRPTLDASNTHLDIRSGPHNGDRSSSWRVPAAALPDIGALLVIAAAMTGADPGLRGDDRNPTPWRRLGYR